MNILVVYNIAGRIEQLEAAIRQVGSGTIGAIYVLGNIVAGTERRAAYMAHRHNDNPPLSSNGNLRYDVDSERATYARVVGVLGSVGVPVYIIPGEQDAPLTELKQAIEAYRGATRILFTHRNATHFGEMDVVVGFGGKLTMVDVDADDQLLLRPRAWEARMLFEHLQGFNTTFQTAQRRILLFATPPQARTLDVSNGEHQGVHVLNEIARQYQPHLVCCGGPASGRGVEVVEGVPVVNPGSLADGEYALVDLDQLSVRFERIVEPVGRVGISFRSILVALNDSPQAWRALELAAELVRSSGAQLTLLHAFEPVRPTLGEPFLETATVKRTADAERFLEEAGSYIPDLNPQASVVEGPAADAILRVADARKVDLIVMGARSRGVVSAVLGSVSRRVVHLAGCPVLIARDQPSSPMLADRIRYGERSVPAVLSHG